jgi:hypothetical protein
MLCAKRSTNEGRSRHGRPATSDVPTKGIMGGVKDSAKQVLGRIAEVWQIDTGRVRWSTKERQDALAFENYIVDKIRANIGARNAIDALWY